MKKEILKNRRSFKALTFLSLFGLAITVPLLLLVGALLLQSAAVQRGELESRVLQVLNALVNDLDRDLDRDITVLRTLSTSRALETADWPTFYEQAIAGLQGRAYLVLVDSTGRQLVNTYVPYGRQPAMTGDPESLHRILQTKEPAISNLFQSLVVKKPVFNVSIPIIQNGEVRYVMSLGLLPDDLVALLQAQRLGPDWITLIWDTNGIILARSREDQRFVGKPLPANMRERDHRAIVRTSNLDGKDVLHATARSALSGWGVAVNVPYSSVVQQTRNSLLLWGAAGVLAIIIALVSGVFVARQITAPLSVASNAAIAFGRGELVPLTGSHLKEADDFLVTLNKAQAAREELMREVKQSRDWLQTTLSSIGDAVIATDSQGRITFLNGVSQNLTGWTMQEALGKPVEQVFVIRHAHTGQEVENPVAKVLREGRIVGLANHTRLIAKDGRSIPIDDSAAPIRDGGSIAGVILVFRDVTERLKADELIRIAVEADPHAMIMVGLDGHVALVNSQTEKLFGYNRNELLGNSIHVLVPERYRAGHELFRSSFFREPRARAMGLDRELFGLRKDGREVPIEIGLNPISTSQGDFVLASIIDISERKEAEAALRQSEQRLATVMRHLPVGVGLIDTEGRVLIANPAWKKLLRGDMPSIDPVESTRWKARTPDGQPLPFHEYPGQRALRGEEVLPGIDFLRKEDNGAERWTRLGAVPLRDETGRITGALAILQDIEEERRAESQRAELAAKAHALESEKILRETEAELARVMRSLSLGELATSIAHEVNQPLAGVVTNAEAGLRWLRAMPPNIAEARESLSMIAEDGERAAEIIRRLREFLRKRTPEIIPLSINQVIQEATAIARSELAKRQVELRMDLSDDLPPVRGDRIQLQQVILNLVMNAAEAIAPNAASKQIVIASRRSADGQLTVAVRDSGSGISAEDLPRIFDPFFTTKPAGIGMGLSISRSILEAFGGRIWAEANPDSGLTVQFSLPAQPPGVESSGASE